MSNAGSELLLQIEDLHRRAQRHLKWCAFLLVGTFGTLFATASYCVWLVFEFTVCR